MGCDVHPALEAQQADGRWTCLGALTGDRNYEAFAMLAGVRNSRSILPISLSRGLPDDMADGTREHLSGEHSETWISLEDLLHYDWEQTVRMSGWVSRWEWREWRRAQQWRPLAGPRRYAAGVGGPSIQHISAEAMDVLIRDLPKDPPRNSPFDTHYAEAVWRQPHWMVAGEIVQEWLPRMISVAHRTGLSSSQVRVVMDFDS